MNSEEAIKHLENDWYIALNDDLVVNSSYKMEFSKALEIAIEALKEPFEQIKWERDMALDTLKQHGIGLGQNPKRGEWKAFTRSQFMGLDEFSEPIYRDGKIYHCSNCGRRTVIKENYCPNCGADMKGEIDAY